ncbi:hypothetical protein L195_g059367, partial [Trifolium pratense]
MYNMHVPAFVDDLTLKTIVQDETDGIEIDVRINVETSSPTSASSVKEAGSTQGGVQ